jgi:hypothetical protein
MGSLDQAEQVGQTEQDGGAGKKRDRTQIEFPYSDMSRSHELTKALGDAGGKVWIDQTQLAVAMDMSVGGGTFRGRLSAAKMFGFVETDSGRVRLSDLGILLLDEATERTAKADAFLRVPLYAAMYNSYNGFALPPAAAIERQMQSLGVPPKQAERARQAFAASAQTAGYIASNGRFSKPALPPAEVRDRQPDDTRHESGGGPASPPPNGGGSGGGGGGVGGGTITGKDHPLIQGMLMTLPTPGSEWPATERKAWLIMANSIFGMIYKATGDQPKPAASTESYDEVLG